MAFAQYPFQYVMRTIESLAFESPRLPTTFASLKLPHEQLD